MNTPARRALYDNLGKNEALALQVDQAVHAASQDDWRSILWVAKTSSAHQVANLQGLTGELLPRAFFTLALSNAK
jgi:type I restriction enzyme R subunit